MARKWNPYEDTATWILEEMYRMASIRGDAEECNDIQKELACRDRIRLLRAKCPLRPWRDR